MKQVLQELGSVKKFVPKILPDTGVDEAQAIERWKLVSRVTESEGDIAEHSVVSQWQTILQTSDPHFREVLPKEAPITFWNEH